MEPKDIRNNIIKEGCFVKYIGTNTVGVVLNISIRDEQAWIKIDKTGLYYLSEYLLVVDPSELGRREKSRSKNVVNLLKPLKNFKKATSTQISDHNDGPGYGGG